jgi:hypothetical protein
MLLLVSIWAESAQCLPGIYPYPAQQSVGGHNRAGFGQEQPGLGPKVGLAVKRGQLVGIKWPRSARTWSL